jgi:hypothetical protein
MQSENKYGFLLIFPFLIYVFPTVRFLRSNEFKDKFSSHQDKIEFLLVAQMAGDVAQIRVDIRALLDRMTTPMSDNEQRARELTNSKGLEQVIAVCLRPVPVTNSSHCDRIKNS